MKTAKSMFRNIGYIEEKTPHDDYEIKYIKDNYEIIFIDLEHKEIDKFNTYNHQRMSITFEELECIKKLIEEVTNNEEC